MVVASSAADPGASCVLMPGTTRQQLLDRAKQLEAEAAEAHRAAQALNKQQRFEEAQAAYEAMKRLDAEALHVTRQLGCQECMVAAEGDSSSSSGDGGAAAAEPADEAARAVYEQLHTPQPWPGDGQEWRDRAMGCMLACLTCDAAATGVQWIYDVDQLAQLLAQRQEVAGAEAAFDGVGLEYYDPVQSPYLRGYSSGRNSPYGEQTGLLLHSLAQTGGLDCAAYAAAYHEAYSAEGWDGYMNASTVAFLRTYGRGLRPPATGADDAQADCVARLAPLVTMFAGDSRLMQLVAAVTRVTQGTDTAVAWACAGAAVLERLLHGAGAAQAVRDTAQELRKQAELQQGRMPIAAPMAAEVAAQLAHVQQLRAVPHMEAVEELGRNCHLPNSCQTPLHVVLHHEHQLQQHQHQQEHKGSDLLQLQPMDKQCLLVTAVRDALAAGGCCASRAGFAGACLGAMLGTASVPEAWLRRCAAAEQVHADAARVCAARTH